MRRRSRTLLGLALVATATPAVVHAGPSAAAADPVRSVTVRGQGVETFPAYDAAVGRFALRTTGATAGAVTVEASTSDPAGTVLVNGRPAGDAGTRVEGLRPGDEVNVQISDAGGTSNQSFVYLPAGFPRIQASRSGAGPSAGAVFLGLNSYLSETTYQTAVDEHGVPLHVEAADKAQDFKPSGADPAHYTVARLRPDSTEELERYRIDELGPRFQRVASHTLAPVERLGVRPKHTDFHDVQMTDDGRIVLVGYHRRKRSNGRTWLDAIIQVTDRRGRAEFTWTSKGAIRPSDAYVLGAKGRDYAHVNSVQLQPNGDIVASFRNVGQVLRIATRSHHGHRPGDVVWRLGGERNEFTFVDDPYGGFCAQHDARILPDGHLLLFDNGSRKEESGALFPQTADMCPDPARPDGPRIARPQSRVVEYVLDPRSRTATLVWSHEVPGRYAAFAGNAQRLDTGRTLVGWWHAQDPGGGTAPFVSEVDPAGTEVWSLTAEGWFSYRAHRGPAPDRTRPGIAVTTPAPGATYGVGEVVLADFGCTDRGGSNLDACAGTVGNGEALDTSPGEHLLTVSATDRAGNTRVRTVAYRAE